MIRKAKRMEYTEQELATMRRFIESHKPWQRIVHHGNGMAQIVARHGDGSVYGKLMRMRKETPPHKLAPEWKSVWEHRGVWFLLGMIFAFSIALLI